MSPLKGGFLKYHFNKWTGAAKDRLLGIMGFAARW